MSQVVMYVKSWCPYCRMAMRLLASKGRDWREVDLEAEPERRAEMVRHSGRATVPQIWIGERHVGGYDDLAALEARGELDALLAGVAAVAEARATGSDGR